MHSNARSRLVHLLLAVLLSVVQARTYLVHKTHKLDYRVMFDAIRAKREVMDEGGWYQFVYWPKFPDAPNTRWALEQLEASIGKEHILVLEKDVRPTFKNVFKWMLGIFILEEEGMLEWNFCDRSDVVPPRAGQATLMGEACVDPGVRHQLDRLSCIFNQRTLA
eukprot:gene14977-21035_t